MTSGSLYQPLDPSKSQIRVVKIHPGTGDEPIHCDMNTIEWRYDGRWTTSKTHYYEALSYEWGSESSLYEITIDGKPFMIRENLRNALLEFRSAGLLGPIWIDVMCVNQADMEERNAQVSLMHLIYGSADLVRVWLGKEDQDSGEALTLLWKISKFVTAVLERQVLSNNRGTLPESDYLIRDLLSPEQTGGVRQKLDLYEIFDNATEEEGDCAFCASGKKAEGACTYSHLRRRWQDILCANNGQWRALSSLLHRSYWSRIWIVQEFILGKNKTIHFGRQVISTEDYAYAHTRGRHYNMDTETLEVALSHILSLDLGRHSGINPGTQDIIFGIQSCPGTLIVKYATPWLSERRSLLKLLITCKDSKATEPRDKIYALLGVAWDIWEFDVKVDYSKSISEIKLDVIRWYMSLNIENEERAAKMWIALDDMLPETLDTAAKMERERRFQSIIQEFRPVPEHVKQIQEEIKQFNATLEKTDYYKKVSPQMQRWFKTVDEAAINKISVKG